MLDSIYQLTLTLFLKNRFFWHANVKILPSFAQRYIIAAGTSLLIQC